MFQFSELILTCSCIQIGKTKVFLRGGQMAELDTRRIEVLGRSASIIQRKVRSYLSRRSYVKLRLSAIRIQSALRGKVSKDYRRYQVSKLYPVLLSTETLRFTHALDFINCRTTCSTCLRGVEERGFLPDDPKASAHVSC